MNDKIQVDPFNLSGGIASLHNNIVFQPSHTPRVLHTQNEHIIHSTCDHLFNNSLTLSLVLFEDDRIVYERYRKPSSKSTPMFTWSITKSLIGWLIGYIIENITKPASNYSRFLTEHVLGETTVEQYLKMSGGHVFEDDYLNTALFPLLRDFQLSQEEVFSLKYTKVFDSGKGFLYNNIDTQILTHLTQQNGSEVAFSRLIIDPAGLKNRSYWLHDRRFSPIGMAGYSVTTRDLLRLAIRFRDELSTNKYMNEMIIPQILNYPKTNGFNFENYGYHIWCGKDSFWWIGMGGQRVGIDIKRNKILVTFRFGEYGIEKVYRLFKQFQES